MTNEQLVIRIKAGEDVAGNMQQLYDQTKAFIHTVAMRYRGRAELEDLEQEGYLALYPAIDGYDPDRGMKFLTYAEYHIRKQMQRYIHDCSHNFRMPQYCHERLVKYQKFCGEFLAKYSRDPSDEESAYFLGMSVQQIHEIKKNVCLSKVRSLDSYLTEDEDITLGETVPGKEDMEGDVVDQMAHKQLQETLWPLVDALPGKQGAVIRARYQDGMSLPEIAIHIEAEKEEVQKLQAKALNGLRHPSILKKLSPFLPEVMESMAYKGNGAETFNRSWTSSTERVAMLL